MLKLLKHILGNQSEKTSNSFLAIMIVSGKELSKRGLLFSIFKTFQFSNWFPSATWVGERIVIFGMYYWLG